MDEDNNATPPRAGSETTASASDALVQMVDYAIHHGWPYDAQKRIEGIREADKQRAALAASASEQGVMGAEVVDDDLVKRLRNTPNWRRESYGSWKDCVTEYDRAPFEAADEIERLRTTLAASMGAEKTVEVLWRTLKEAVAMIDNLRYSQAGDGAHEDTFDVFQRIYRDKLNLVLTAVATPMLPDEIHLSVDRYERMARAAPALCVKPACPENCCGCNHAINGQQTRDYAIRYAYLRSRPLDAISAGGVFIGRTPQNQVLNEEDADAAIDSAMLATPAAPSQGAGTGEKR